MSAPLSMAEVAAAVGLHYDTFRKRWPQLRKSVGFPPPYLLRPLRWRAEAIELWKQGRERALGSAELRKGANDFVLPPRMPSDARLAGERAELRLLMGGRA